jgi:hypothetical protein
MAKRMKYTEEQLEFLKTGYKMMKTADLVKSFNDKFGINCSFKQIRRTLDRYNFRAGRKPGFPEGMPLNLFTKAEIVFLKAYAHMKTQDVVDLFNQKFERKRTFDSINTKLTKLGLAKAKMKKRKVGEVYSYHKQGYPLVKTHKFRCGRTFRHYKYKHIAVWEKANGPVPEGHCVRFLDSDNTNCALGNLILVSKSEHGRLYNSLQKVEPELRESVVAVVRLEANCAALEKANS